MLERKERRYQALDKFAGFMHGKIKKPQKTAAAHLYISSFSLSPDFFGISNPFIAIERARTLFFSSRAGISSLLDERSRAVFGIPMKSTPKVAGRRVKFTFQSCLCQKVRFHIKIILESSSLSSPRGVWEGARVVGGELTRSTERQKYIKQNSQKLNNKRTALHTTGGGLLQSEREPDAH